MEKWRSYSVALDAQGRAVKPFDLGWLFLPLFAAYRILAESRSGRTLGRWMSRIRLVGANGDPPLQLLRRYVVFIAPAIPLAVLDEPVVPGRKALQALPA